jgi:hypothetical protein
MLSEFVDFGLNVCCKLRRRQHPGIGSPVYEPPLYFPETSTPEFKNDAAVLLRIQLLRIMPVALHDVGRPIAGEADANLLGFVIREGFAHPVSRSPGPRTAEKGIIVLPFLLWGYSDHANPSHTLVVSDQLIYLLTRSSPFRVLSRFAALNAAPEMDAKQLGKHFNARFIIEGSIRIVEDD